MLRRVAWRAMVVASFVPSCGGESQVVEQPGASSPRAGRAGAGSGGGAGMSAAGAGGCSECSGGAAGLGGTGDVAGGAGDGGRGGGGGTSAAGRAGAVGHAGDRPGTSAGRGGGSTGGTAGMGSGGGSGGAGKAAGAGGSGGSSGGTAGRAASGGATSEGGAAGEPNPLSGKLAITKVAVYQAVEVTLMQGGTDKEANAPVIAGREAFVRVSIKPNGLWAPRTVSGEITVTNGTASRSSTLTLDVLAASTDLDLGSTFDFKLRDTEVTSDTAVAVSIHETTAAAPELTHWPASGSRGLAAVSSNGPILITLVPLVVSGFTPDTGATAVNRYQRYASRIYPVSRASVTVHAPVTIPFGVDADGTGWDDALDALYAVRDRDNPAANVYYYGILTPGATYQDYCPTDCVVGLSSVAAPDEEQYRGAIGTGYFESDTDTFSQETLAHELGHALGREHAPCGGADGPDPSFPYQQGQIGVTGYDGVNLLDRDLTKDVMSYCVPVWISDFMYAGIYTRIAYVNGLVAMKLAGSAAPRASYRTLTLRGDGSLHWGYERTPHSAPAGTPVNVELLDRSGSLLGVVSASFVKHDHLGGGFLSVPSSALVQSGVTHVRVGGTVLAVPGAP
jgi:hypothetical protein